MLSFPQFTDLAKLQKKLQQFNLLPRRQEILNIITDHPYCSADFIARRFPTIPKRTIQYDLAQLIKNKLVNKYGQTKGVVYSASQITE